MVHATDMTHATSTMFFLQSFFSYFAAKDPENTTATSNRSDTKVIYNTQES
jgi:hypothetical protein